MRFVFVEIQERDLFVWLETLTPAMSVCFRNWFYIADIIGSNVYVCIYMYIHIYVLIYTHACIYGCIWVYIFTEGPQT